ncbi:MAG: hypothetical protein ABIJ14_00040 [Nanoarchaeota archaeon]
MRQITIGKINLQLSNRAIYTLTAMMFVVLVGIGFTVYAYGGSSPSVVGHSAGEIEVDNTLCSQITGHNCGYDTDTNTDTKCDSSGQCSQVCVGSDCRSGWPISGWPAGSYCIMKNGVCPSGFTHKTLSSEVARPSWSPNYHDAGNSYFGNDYVGNVHYHAFHMQLEFCCK